MSVSSLFFLSIHPLQPTYLASPRSGVEVRSPAYHAHIGAEGVEHRARAAVLFVGARLLDANVHKVVVSRGDSHRDGTVGALRSVVACRQHAILSIARSILTAVILGNLLKIGLPGQVNLEFLKFKLATRVIFGPGEYLLQERHGGVFTRCQAAFNAVDGPAEVGLFAS